MSRGPSFKAINPVIEIERLIYFYIANARLPTEAANRYQSCQMCEAFAQNGAKMLLLPPDRRQSTLALYAQSVFDHMCLLKPPPSNGVDCFSSEPRAGASILVTDPGQTVDGASWGLCRNG